MPDVPAAICLCNLAAVHWGPSDEEEPGNQPPGPGWVPPEARSWRHPSELHAAAFAAVFALPRHRWRRRAAVVGAAALVAVAAGTLLLVQSGSSPPGPVDVDSMTVSTAAITACCRISPSVVRGVEEMVVSIEQLSGRHDGTGCGVVVGDGLVATTARAVRGARRVRVLAATGRPLTGTVVASDGPSGIAVLRISAPLASPDVQSASALRAGSAAVAVTLRAARPGARPEPSWTSGTVVSVDGPAPDSHDGGFGAIAVRGTSVPTMPGEALLDPAGHVEGILAGTRGSERVFLPMAVVTSISYELDTLGKVRHGWLGVADKTQAGRSGAVVVWVDPRGASAGQLAVGDTIVRVDGERVTSSTALRSMLYLMAPGTPVRVDAVRGAHEVHAVVRLAPAP
jgi:S1-C subfamily serine protease